MTQATLVVMLQNNLEIITDYMDADAKAAKEAELLTYIQAAESYIKREGITLDIAADGSVDAVGDAMLVVMYAGWLYDRRKDPTAVMPRMLRWNLNNRLISQKAAEDAT